MNVSLKILLVAVVAGLTLMLGAAWAFAQGNTPGFGDLTCATGQIAKFSGSAWACADDLAEMQAQLDDLAVKVDPEAEFIATVNAFEAAIKANDADRVMQFYADDVVALLPGMEPLVGKEAVRADWEATFDAFKLDREAELVYVNVDGDSAERRMSWTNTLTPKDGGEPIVLTGNCMLGFKKINGQWKTVWDMTHIYEPTAQ